MEDPIRSVLARARTTRDRATLVVAAMDAHYDPDLMRLLDAIAMCEPSRLVPDLDDVSDERRATLMGEAYRNGWVTISSFRGDSATMPGETLRLTSDGRAALDAARAAQDFDAADDGLDAAGRQQRRTRFIKALYDDVGDNTGRVVTSASVGQSLGWEIDLTKSVVRYLASKGLLAYRGLGGQIAITQAGIDEIERALASPAQPTEHFASVNVSIGTAHGPVQVVQGGQAKIADAALGPPASVWRRVATRLITWTGLIIMGAIGSLVAAAVIWQISQDDGAHRTALLTIDNRVTNGPIEMREDTSLLRLVREPALSCFQRPSCALQEPSYKSGDRVSAVCITQGDRVTNGSDGDSVDDGNPSLYESTLWYGVRAGGQLVYISEVWIDRHGRGGMGLPRCE